MYLMRARKQTNASFTLVSRDSLHSFLMKFAHAQSYRSHTLNPTGHTPKASSAGRIRLSQKRLSRTLSTSNLFSPTKAAFCMTKNQEMVSPYSMPDSKSIGLVQMSTHARKIERYASSSVLWWWSQCNWRKTDFLQKRGLGQRCKKNDCKHVDNEVPIASRGAAQLAILSAPYRWRRVPGYNAYTDLAIHTALTIASSIFSLFFLWLDGISLDPYPILGSLLLSTTWAAGSHSR